MPEERYKPTTMILTDPDEKNEQKERKKKKMDERIKFSGSIETRWSTNISLDGKTN